VARRSIASLCAVVALCLLAACGHAETPATPAPAQPPPAQPPPVVQPPPPSPPPPPSNGPRGCTTDADCAGLPPHDGATWTCKHPDPAGLAAPTDPKYCEPLWPDGTRYCDTIDECPVRPPIPDYSWTTACTDHHCVQSGHPGMEVSGARS
jgi:hypothetical protein